jgi:hypothetical protein
LAQQPRERIRSTLHDPESSARRTDPGRRVARPGASAGAQAYGPPLWSNVGGLPGAGLFGSLVAAAMTPAGNAGAVIANPAGSPLPTRLVRFNDGQFVLAADDLGLTDGHVVAAQGDHLVVAGSSTGAVGHLRVATALGAGGPIATTSVPDSAGLRVAALAANGAGAVALVGASATGRVVYLRAARRRAFHAVLTIAVGDPAGATTVALGPTGDLLVAWVDRAVLVVAHRGARSWARGHVLGAEVRSDPQALIDGSGRETVAWTGQAADEGAASAVDVATAARGHSWGPAREVEPLAADGATFAAPAPGFLLRATSDHHTLLAWTGRNATNDVVKVMTLTDGRPGGVQTLSPPTIDASLGDVATVAGDGPALVLWRLDSDPVTTVIGPRLLASARPSGARRFGDPEVIANFAAGPVPAPTAMLGSASHLATALYPTQSGIGMTLRQPITP